MVVAIGPNTHSYSGSANQDPDHPVIPQEFEGNRVRGVGIVVWLIARSTE